MMNKKAVGWSEIGKIVIVLLIILIGFVIVGHISGIGQNIITLGESENSQDLVSSIIFLAMYKIKN